jgi:hypothetical protein
VAAQERELGFDNLLVASQERFVMAAGKSDKFATRCPLGCSRSGLGEG